MLPPHEPGIGDATAGSGLSSLGAAVYWRDGRAEAITEGAERHRARWVPTESDSDDLRLAIGILGRLLVYKPRLFADLRRRPERGPMGQRWQSATTAREVVLGEPSSLVGNLAL